MSSMRFHAELFIPDVGVVPVCVTVTHHTIGTATCLESIILGQPGFFRDEIQAIADKIQQIINPTKKEI